MVLLSIWQMAGVIENVSGNVRTVVAVSQLLM
jgi:hypothetical protein